VIALVAVGVLWEAFLRVFDVNPYFAKTPADVWEYLVSGPGAAARRTIVFDAMGETARTAALGFTVGIVGAVLLAALFVTVPAVERALLPVAVALRSVPIVATTPLIILLLGRGIVGPVVIVAIMSFFPTLVNCVFGMRRTPGQVLDVLRSYNAGPVAVLGTARLPSAVPAILASARIAVPASLLGVTVAEWLATGRGIGNLMVIASSTARYDTLWACVAVLTLFAVICYSAVAAIESVVLRWMAPERSA
jgi:ABC-type nitrate/sulfonate/bicarbonate transport system permease component